MPILETRKLTLQAGNKVLCKQLDWQCHAGEIWAVLGRNGAGKTRLLHALAGLPHDKQIHCHGDVLLNNKPLPGIQRKHIAQQLGLLLQDYHEPFPGTVMEYAMMGRHPYLHAWQWESAQDYAHVSTALNSVGLDGFHQRNIQTLSGGEFQRMRIAMLLVQDPQILLLDEPVNHLDLQFQHALLSMLTRNIHGSNKAVVMTLHDINLAMRYATHALLIYEDGEIACGGLDDVINEKNLTTLYRCPFRRLTDQQQQIYVAGE